MVVLLFEYEVIKIILLKVKELCWVVEFLIILVKEDLVVNCCLVFDCIWFKEMVGKLFNELGLCYKVCSGGYLCIFKMGFWVGDNVFMVYVELVDCLEGEVVDVE